MISKGIILAGGTGTRLHPLTKGLSKQLMPIYDKPMIYYPLSTLMLAGIREVLIITTPHEQMLFQGLLGDGESWGMRFEYAVQPSPDGLAQAFLIGEDFIGGDACALVLGRQHLLRTRASRSARRKRPARRWSDRLRILREQPKRIRRRRVQRRWRRDRARGKARNAPSPTTRWPGLYFYDQDVVAHAKALKPSARGELEITDLNRRYLDAGKLHLQKFGRGVAWLDTGTPVALLQAANFVQTIQERQGLRASCPEEISFRMGWIDADQLARLAEPLEKTEYGQYLHALAAGLDI